MSNGASIVDPFHRDLYNRLSSQIDDRMVSLAKGTAVKTELDQVSTAEKYAAQVSYIQALNDVLDVCKELEMERYGPRPGADEQQQGS